MTQGQIRIIGGQWRGRKVKVPELTDLRPTPDRVRETLFNWLQPIIVGTHCLDLFAGSGALGFEALSRGASHVVMVDHEPKIIDLLRQQLKIFGATNAEVYQAEVPKQLRRPNKPFDLVFLDPPFKEDLLLPCCAFLEEMGFLADKAHLYLEAKEIICAEMLPPNWEILKSKKAGLVAYHLVLRQAK